VTKLRVGRPRSWGSIPVRDKRFFFLASIPTLETTQPPVQRLPKALSWAKEEGRDADYLLSFARIDEPNVHSLSLFSTIEELLGRKSSGSDLENPEYAPEDSSH
jgi:hypothetical protein